MKQKLQNMGTHKLC